MENNPQKIIQFSEIKQDLLTALNVRITEGKLKLPEKVNLVDGFINQLITPQISNSFILGGPTVPMITVVGESGQIYFFALRALLPNLFE